MTEQLERQLIELIALDRIDRPISSMSGKLKRRKPKLVQAVDISAYDVSFEGDRVWAMHSEQDRSKARGMREGVEKFSAKHPKYGKILNGYIEEERTVREKYLVFGMQDGARVTSKDYTAIMADLGFTPATAKSLYGELTSVSRDMAQKRNEEERSVLIDTPIWRG